MSKSAKQPDDLEEAAEVSENASPAENGEFEVGYKKPPKDHQFKPGNKLGKGRKKGSKNLKTIVQEAMGQKVPVKVAGKNKKMTKVELAVHQVATKASQGDAKAAEKAIALYERYGPQDDPEGPPKEKLEKDLSSLKKYLEMNAFLHPDEENGND